MRGRDFNRRQRWVGPWKVDSILRPGDPGYDRMVAWSWNDRAEHRARTLRPKARIRVARWKAGL